LPLDGAILGISRAPLSSSKGGVEIASGTPMADHEQPSGMEGAMKYDLLLDRARCLFGHHRHSFPP
jgi:hypothetical protein